VVILLDAAFAADDDRRLAAALVGDQLDDAGDFRQHRWILGLAGLENFRHARQTRRDVRGALGFLGLTGEQVARPDAPAVVTADTRFGREIVEVENLAIGVFDDDARVALALVLGDHQAAGAALLFGFGAGRFALDDIFKPDLTGFLSENRRTVRVPCA